MSVKTTANYATFPNPRRLAAIRRSVESILPQVDLVRICWNKYNIDDIPFWFFTSKIENVIPDTDLTDNGKFAFIRPGEKYLTCDDDIFYPTNYVESFPDNIPISTHHGRILHPDGYYSYYRGKHKCYSYLNDTQESTVHVGGTGVMCINTDLYMPNIHESPYKKMSDLVLSLDACDKGIPIQLLAHKQCWLQHIPCGEQTIGNAFRLEESQQIELLNKIMLIFDL